MEGGKGNIIAKTCFAKSAVFLSLAPLFLQDTGGPEDRNLSRVEKLDLKFEQSIVLCPNSYSLEKVHPFREYFQLAQKRRLGFMEKGELVFTQIALGGYGHI